MKLKSKVFLVALSTLLIAGNSTLVSKAEQPAGEYIVVFDNQANEQSEAAKLRSQGANIKFTYSTVFKGLAGTFNSAQLAALQRNPRVQLIEADSIVTADVTQTGATWGLDRIDQSNLPLNGSYIYDKSGAGVYAFVIDTGIYAANEDFGGRVNTTYGNSYISDGNGTTDCNGHGTHVAGTIGGATYGVAKSVTLVPVRVLDCSGSGSTSGVIAGVNWVATQVKNNNLKAVANMSLGGGKLSSLNTAVDSLVKAGVTVAVAAGNSNRDACQFSPASTPSAITVGATTSTDSRASYSNFGSCLDVFAPGSGITSTWIGATNATNTISGTSMASPHVAGVAALYLSSNSALTPAQIASNIILSSTTNKVTSAGSKSPNRLLNKGTI